MLALFAATGGLLPSSTAAFAAFPAALTAPIAAPCPHGHARSVLLVPSTSSSRVGTSRVAMMAGDEERERSAQSKMEMRLDGRDESELDECSLDDPHVEDCLRKLVKLSKHDPDSDVWEADEWAESLELLLEEGLLPGMPQEGF